MRRLEEGVFVAGQIRPEDVPGFAAQGVRLIVNNRPGGEEPGQPTGAEIEAAASAAGVGYRFIPVSHLTPEAVAAMGAALEEADGPVLAFCRSGTRSTYLWALARARRGADADTLIQQAARAGYDLAALRSYLG
ncbi:MAG: TIGR01244 family sulfur transferase [Sphingosinicella sp.]|uniref:TIGR01244 family sulfur transferase n=1 Tax=Sphingosinicella sp. TaxID=1917971 RepID=UPI004037FA22